MKKITEGEKIYRILRRTGEISEHHSCVGQINAFGLLVKENEIERKISLLKNLTELPITILGIRESGRIFSHSRIMLPKTDCRLMHFLTENPRARVGDIAKAAGVTTKTAKRRLDKLVEDRTISFTTVFRPEALRGYLMFYVLMNIKKGSSSKVMQEIRTRYSNIFFQSPPFNQVLSF